MVAAWMSAETGVGPPIASGSHTYRGSCADLPVAPAKRSNERTEAAREPCESVAGAPVKIVWKSSVPNNRIIQIIATTTAASPIRFTRKALVPAEAAADRSNQKAIRRYEQRPTPSHPKKRRRELSAKTKTSISARKRLSSE